MTLRVATIGDGAMATVCSRVLASKSTGGAPLEVRVWGRDAGRLTGFNGARENTRYLPGVKLPENLQFVADDAGAFEGARLVICAVPTQFIRGALTRLGRHIPAHVPVVSVAKGIEISTLLRPTQVIEEVLGKRPVAALSGPNIAGEMGRNLPATMVVAAEDETIESPAARKTACEELSLWIQELFTTPTVRVYRNNDLLGVELAGALKNVVAIAAGILEGMRAGYNAKAALLTRGLVEITRLGVAMGAMPETFAGLAGLGDLVTTCFSPEGRNRSFGERIGKGEKSEDVLGSMVGVVEGVPTTKAVVDLAHKKGVEMPISEGLHAVLFEGSDPRAELADLMSRQPKRETPH